MPHCDDDTLPPLSAQLKFQLIDLARELHLADDGRVAGLRLRIRDHLTGNPKLLARQRYANLLPSFHLPPPQPLLPTPDLQPTHTSPRLPNESESSSFLFCLHSGHRASRTHCFMLIVFISAARHLVCMHGHIEPRVLTVVFAYCAMLRVIHLYHKLPIAHQAARRPLALLHIV